MKKSMPILFAAVLSTSAFSFPFAAARSSAASPQSSISLATPAKTSAHDATHEARRIAAEAADRALGPSAVNQVLKLIVASDRDRLEKNLTKGDDNAYQAEVDKVHKAWKAKYDENFSAQGRVHDLADVTVTVTGNGPDSTAVLTLPAEPGEKAYTLHLTKEKSGYWRINLPDSVDGATFYASMMKSVEKLAADIDKLPADKDKAYERAVTELLEEMSFPTSK